MIGLNKSEFALNDKCESKIDAPEIKNIAQESKWGFFDADEYWDNFFDGVKRQENNHIGVESCRIPDNVTIVDGKYEYHDDNGNVYRVDKELLPDNHYCINGYEYDTDHLGRITRASGELHIKDREGRLPIRDSLDDIGKGDQHAGDDRGHLIGDQFDGTNGLENMVPQDAEINRNDFMHFENQLAKSVKEGNVVTVDVQPIYEADSRRPVAIMVSYTINGEEDLRIFPNNTEE